MTSALAVEALTVRSLAGAVLVDRAGLTVPSGGSLCVIGETGSGKSLVALAVMGLLPDGLFASGRIAFMGCAFDAADRAGLRRLWGRASGIIPQEPSAAFDPLMRLAGQLGDGAAPPDRLRAALADVDLAPSALALHPFQLSGGMAQRALVANARLSDARLVIADEPTKGLDRDRGGQVIDLLLGLRAAGKALLVVTHDLAVAKALGGPRGRIAVMRAATIVEDGLADAVLATPRHPYTRAWLDADPSRWPECPTCLAADDVVLAAHGLSFGYDAGRPLFRDLNIHVRRGEVLAVTGPSGVGKSTLGDVLLALKRPSAGAVSWRGADPCRDAAARRRLRRRYQKLHQDPAAVFAPHRPIGAQLRDVAPERAADLPALLDRLRLGAGLLERRVGEVSGGEAQRLALARLLLMDPWLIVADEPTSRLDPIVQREAMLIMRDLVAERGLALLLISHHAGLVEAVADARLDLGAMREPAPKPPRSRPGPGEPVAPSS